MRILLADDETRVRSALRLLLEQELGENVVGEAAQAQDLPGLVQTTQPDLLLLDWELPCLGHALLHSLRALAPTLKVIALSGRLESARTALTEGVDAFVSKGDPPERLVTMMQKIK